MRRTVCVALVLLGIAGSAACEETPVAVDGLFEDWGGIDVCWMDPSGDGNVIDFGSVLMRSDDERITLLLDVGSEISLQGGNLITLLIDGDDDVSTGRAIEGIGAELAWTFGKREGKLWSDDEGVTVEHADIGLRQAPTVSSGLFEVSFLRRARDGADIAPGPRASFVLIDDESDTGDRLPDEGSVTVQLTHEPAPPLQTVHLERRSPDDIRVVTWNVLFDGLFKRPAPFIRVLRALDPDVICFQEIWAHTSQQAADQVSLALPGPRWYGASSGEGHIVSRYPLLHERSIDESGNYWALIDLPDDRYGVDLSVVSAHPPCCDKEVERQRELDGIAAWLRELQTPGGVLEPPDEPPLEFDLPEGTPIVIAGDMNLVGGAGQVRTLTDGEIVDEETFGPSHPADWDGTPLADTWPRVNGWRDVFTWRDARSSFSPGKLDYIVYSDSVLELRRAFALETSGLTEEDLERYGLRAEDTLDASDHLPVVADFTPAAAPARTEAAE
ncbi:MAG: endonuclease/exonuclease/phosphatase family protein [Candidatus Eisenbacteria bacterium]